MIANEDELLRGRGHSGEDVALQNLSGFFDEYDPWSCLLNNFSVLCRGCRCTCNDTFATGDVGVLLVKKLLSPVTAFIVLSGQTTTKVKKATLLSHV